MRGLIKYFIRYPINGNLLVFLIFIFGFFGLRAMKTTFFPSIENRNINIQVVYPGASPEEMEEGMEEAPLEERRAALYGQVLTS